MRIFALGFFMFAIAALLLFARYSPLLQIPADISSGMLIALLVMAMIMQIEGVFQLRTKQAHHATTDELARAQKELQSLQREKQDQQNKAVKENQQQAELQQEIAQLKQEQKKLRQHNPNDNVLVLLSLLQEKGRFIDFIRDDVSLYADEQVGSAARVVHQGCSQVFSDFFAIEPIEANAEGSTIQLTADEQHMASPQRKILGATAHSNPQTGTILHRGWKASSIHLPEKMTSESQDSFGVIAPCEVDVS